MPQCTQSSIFWYTKMGTFSKSAHLDVPKNDTNGNSETIFISPTSPKSDGITFGFKLIYTKVKI